MDSGREQLKAWIKRCKFTHQVDAANLLGLYESLLSMILNGHRKPTLDQANTIEEKTGIPARAWSTNSSITVHKAAKGRQPKRRQPFDSQSVKA